jgi:hypothetical protein
MPDDRRTLRDRVAAQPQDPVEKFSSGTGTKPDDRALSEGGDPAR